jgi:hypothetical protein
MTQRYSLVRIPVVKAPNASSMNTFVDVCSGVDEKDQTNVNSEVREKMARFQQWRSEKLANKKESAPLDGIVIGVPKACLEELTHCMT